VIFRAPRFDASGKKTANAVFVKVVHNGKVIHENQEVTGPTRAAAFNDACGGSDDEPPKGEADRSPGREPGGTRRPPKNRAPKGLIAMVPCFPGADAPGYDLPALRASHLCATLPPYAVAGSSCASSFLPASSKRTLIRLLTPGSCMVTP